MASKDESKKQIETAIALIAVLLIVFSMTTNKTYALVALVFAIAALVLPSIFYYPSKAWFGLSVVMGEVVSRVILTVVYFVFVFPIAALYRLMTKNEKLMRADSKTMFLKREHNFTKKDLEKSF